MIWFFARSLLHTDISLLLLQAPPLIFFIAAKQPYENEKSTVPKAAGKRRAEGRAEGGLSEGEVSDGGASVASSSMSKLARQARNGFDIR